MCRACAGRVRRWETCAGRVQGVCRACAGGVQGECRACVGCGLVWQGVYDLNTTREPHSGVAVVEDGTVIENLLEFTDIVEPVANDVRVRLSQPTQRVDELLAVEKNNTDGSHFLGRAWF